MTRIGTVIVMALLLGVARDTYAQQTLEFSGRTWTVNAQDAAVESYLGEEALRLRNGAVILSDVTFENGTIEYDVATTGHRSFVGTAFRLRQNERISYEHFYLRPHQSGRFDAAQYTPEIGGLAAWQLYPEFNAPVQIPRDEWIHVRLVVSGGRLEAYVGEGEEPTLAVAQLRLEPGPGAVALTSNFPGAATLDLHPTAYANFTLTPSQAAVGDGGPDAEAPPVAPGVISQWALSESVPGAAGHVEELSAQDLSALSWDVVDADGRGRLNIAEHRAFAQGAQQGRVLARVVLDSDAERTVPLGFGFSDRGSVFLNGRLLFTGDNTYRSRSLRYLGVMTVDNDTVFLPLEEGSNELVLAISESFGGWGLVAKLHDMDGVRVVAEPPNGS